MTEEQSGGLSRRELIKRGAVVGGVVWAAPVVQSFASPAFADGSPSGGECTNFYRFKFNWNGSSFVPDSGTRLPGGDECIIEDFANHPLGNEKVVLVGSNPDSKGNPRTVTVSDNPNDSHACEVVILEVKAGARASVGAGMVCASDTDGDGTVSTATGKAISYVAGVICCE